MTTMPDATPLISRASETLHGLFKRSAIGHFLAKAEGWLREHTGDHRLTVRLVWNQRDHHHAQIVVIVSADGVARRVVLQFDTKSITLMEGERPDFPYRQARQGARGDRFWAALRTALAEAAGGAPHGDGDGDGD